MKIQIKHFAITIATVLLCAVASFASVVAVSTMPSAGTANLKVVDISQWNDSITSADDNINFALLKTQVDAVYIRAYGNSNGVSYIDKQAASYAKSSQDANLLYGFYYYYIPKADIADAKLQAQAYYNFVKNYAYSCVPMLDVEDNSNNLTKAELAASVQAFADQFKALSGFSLMIYSYPDFMVHNFDPAQNWTRYKLWIAHYNVSAPMEGISSTWMPSINGAGNVGTCGNIHQPAVFLLYQVHQEGILILVVQLIISCSVHRLLLRMLNRPYRQG